MFRNWRARRAIGALALALVSGPALANPFIIEEPKPDTHFQAIFGLRYWYGFDSTSKDLYGATRATLNSRLSYDGMQTHSLEGYFRVDEDNGLFWKGYAGGGLLTQGNLQDEDFPPGITPYSSTNSTLQNQMVGYLSTDIGGAIWRGSDFRVDGLVGYFYFHQRMKAFGCQQTTSNPDVCAGGIPDSVAVIVEDDTWQALRLGLNADLPVADRWRIDLEGAWLPYVWLSGTDNHLLLDGTALGDFTGPIPEDGTGSGYQFEAQLSYRIDDNFSLGLGGRYWHMQTSGSMHFENHVVGYTTAPQPLDFKVDIYGVFLQGTYHFGPF